MNLDPDHGLDRMGFHDEEECSPAPTGTHRAIRQALADCGVPHPCCATSWSIGHIADEDGVPLPDEPTRLVVFYGHRHLTITSEQEFTLVNAMAEAGVPRRRLDD